MAWPRQERLQGSPLLRLVSNSGEGKASNKALKNFDTFKGLLKKTKGLGIIFTTLADLSKTTRPSLTKYSRRRPLNLSKAAQEGLERAKQFTLEVPNYPNETGSACWFWTIYKGFSTIEKTTVKLGDTGLERVWTIWLLKPRNR